MPPAPNRMESAAGSDPVSAEAPAPAARAAGGGFKSWLPLFITVLMMPALAWAMTTLVLLPQLQKGLGMTASIAPAGSARSKKTADLKKESVPMDKLLVNVAGTMGSRYLLVSLSLVGSDPDFKSKIQDAEPQLRDMACGILASKTLTDLEKPAARNLIRSELLSGFNNILGEGMVQDIYLTEFAIQ